MKTQARVTFVESFAVSPERLFDALLDHEGMSEWMGARVKVVSGPDDGGVGTVRRIAMPGGGALDEEVTYVLYPRRMVYRIVRGLPIVRFHRGEILVEPWGQTGAQLSWDIVLDSAIPGVAAAIVAILRPRIRAGLAKLRGQLAAEREAGEARPAA
ncbi:MAG: SRPBCC family protein [Sandaracinaceae bacterium]|nr:SRPBCC family protein [Sandaracinaceae bacterium]